MQALYWILLEVMVVGHGRLQDQSEEEVAVEHFPSEEVVEEAVHVLLGVAEEEEEEHYLLEVEAVEEHDLQEQEVVGGEHYMKAAGVVGFVVMEVVVEEALALLEPVC
jgi:hypothetical protein